MSCCTIDGMGVKDEAVKIVDQPLEDLCTNCPMSAVEKLKFSTEKIKKKRYPNKKLLVKRDIKVVDGLTWWNNLTCEERERKILLLYTRRKNKNGI
jgi:hypothetical protein